MIAVLGDWADSLARHGFRQLHFVNGHGGNISSTYASFAEIQHQLPGQRCELSNWYELPSVAKLVAERLADNDGMHAAPSELSLSWALHPTHERDTSPQAPAPVSMGVCGADDFRARFPDGRVGADQHLANIPLGQQLLELAVTDLLGVHSAWRVPGDP
jgi:creatinine amidohydrolase